MPRIDDLKSYVSLADSITSGLERALQAVSSAPVNSEAWAQGIADIISAAGNMVVLLQSVVGERDDQWRLRREAEGSRDAAKAACAVLREALTKMRGYAAHDDDCGVNALLVPRLPMVKKCTCGLSAALKETSDGL